MVGLRGWKIGISDGVYGERGRGGGGGRLLTQDTAPFTH